MKLGTEENKYTYARCKNQNADDERGLRAMGYEKAAGLTRVCRRFPLGSVGPLAAVTGRRIGQRWILKTFRTR